ncbi:MAG: HNH endonuclease [Thermoplasmata archaeon]|nr:HNH endonuclease [Thermoplasmata archaeon]
MASVDGPRPERVLRDSARWFSEGAELKRVARRERRCAACSQGLATRRTPYCSRLCQWRFQAGYFWDAARTYTIHRDRFTCRACARRFRVAQLEVDHIVEIARGGAPLDPANLQTLCKGCHRAKTLAFLRGRVRARTSAPPAPRSDGRGSFDVAEWFPA